jgi:predicted signal transduction protein with EAL and GGDEF domain
MRSLFNFPENREGHLAAFAEDIINKIGESSRQFKTTAHLWNAYREQFLEVLNYQPVSDYWTQADAAREELLRWIETLITLLKMERFELTKQHGVSVEKTEGVRYVYKDYGF